MCASSEALLVATRDDLGLQSAMTVSTRDGSITPYIKSVEPNCLTISKVNDRIYTLSSKYLFADDLRDKNEGIIVIIGKEGGSAIRIMTSFQPWYIAEYTSKYIVVAGIDFTLSPSNKYASDGYLVIYDNTFRTICRARIDDCAPLGVVKTKYALYCIYSNGQVGSVRHYAHIHK